MDPLESAMTLSAGMRLGPYEIVGPIGAGGMGEVYRARDTRLGRDVAIKVLPGEVSHTPERLHRFEQEAQLAGTLNHPNVLSVLDVGTHDHAPYLVTELLEGRSLREVLAAGPLSPRKAVEYAQQAAHGLAAAHERGVVHRDLKPANLFVTRDGRIKILDFGLAKLTQVDPLDVADSRLSTNTAEGKVVGTIGYMSPEQVRGQTVDGRSDIFALGAVVYEMLSGRRAFTGDTPADTMTAILTRDPEDLSRPGLVVPQGLDRIVRRCLEKDPAERFQSAKDVAFALEAESGTVQSAPGGAPVAPRRRWLQWAAVAALVALAAAAGAWFSRRLWERPVPRFSQLTFGRGTVGPARFTADGNTVVYTAFWEGQPPEIFTHRLDSSESASLGLPPARLLSVSSRGELAILLTPPDEYGISGPGTLARVPLSGGAVRNVLENVVTADWSPDGTELAVLRLRDGQLQFEYPIGTVLVRVPPESNPNGLRVSPRGDRVALSDWFGVDVVDRSGKTTRLDVQGVAVNGLAWSHRGDSLLVTAGQSAMARTLRRVALDGSVTEVAAVAGTMVLEDVAADGRVLLHHGFERVGVRARPPRDSAEHEVGISVSTRPAGVSDDGSQLLLCAAGATWPGPSFLRRTTGGPAVRVGETCGMALSGDAQWFLARDPRSQSLVLTPTGSGEAVRLSLRGLDQIQDGAWLVDAHRAGVVAKQPGRPLRSFILEDSSEAPRPVTPEGTFAIPGLLPAGSVLGWSADGSLALYPLAGGDPQPLPFRLPTPVPPIGSDFHTAVRVSGDGRFVFVREGRVPTRLARIELATGKKTPWKSLRPTDPAGVVVIYAVRLTPDGEGYAYEYGRFLQDLFLVEGVRY
jgi:hypothetical protein